MEGLNNIKKNPNLNSTQIKTVIRNVIDSIRFEKNLTLNLSRFSIGAPPVALR